MTIEQYQEENEKLKRAIIDIYRNCEECEYQGYGAFYAVDQDSVNAAYELTQSADMY
ncbi:hook protein [Providencia rettgeri]|uniref:hook protein n=1 Tax=Providencia rettgeri TaxID=587 RepID=UPI001EE6F58F|nr:hook protein [Providencia rettgeri]MCG5372000.1 hook protein [Providencia rettgeri]